MAEQEVHIVLLSKDPGRAYTAFQLALASVALGNNAKIYCTAEALGVVMKGGSASVQMQGMPPLSKLLKDCLASGVEISACAPSREFLQQMGITKDTLEEGVGMEDAVAFLNKALPAAKNGGIVTFI